MEVRINKEVRNYQESLFFGLSLRQFIFALLAVIVAVGVYFGLRAVVGEGDIGWLCVLAAFPFALGGFFTYNGMTFEQFNIGVVSTLLLASKIVDGFTDIFAGWLVDNTHTKWGKGRPYELGIVGMTICSILIFAGNPAWSNVVKCVWIFCMYTFTFSIFATLRQAAGNPYTIRHFSNNKTLLTKVSSYGGIVTMAGSMILNIVFPILQARIATSASGWTAAVALVMIPATLIGLLRFIFCKEDPSVDATSKQDPIKVKEIFMLFRRNKYVWFYAIIMVRRCACRVLRLMLAANTPVIMEEK